LAHFTSDGDGDDEGEKAEDLHDPYGYERMRKA
jgi:hypothetical protein